MRYLDAVALAPGQTLSVPMDVGFLFNAHALGLALNPWVMVLEGSENVTTSPPVIVEGPSSAMLCMRARPEGDTCMAMPDIPGARTYP